MSVIDPEIKKVLDVQLAKGELDMAGYQYLIKTIMQDVGVLCGTPGHGS